MPTARHVSLEEGAAERGMAFGRAHAIRVAHTIDAYRRLIREATGLGSQELRDLGENVGEVLSQGSTAPMLEELHGMAHGARVDVRDLLAVNARSEILAGDGGGECTVVGLLGPQPGQCLLAQNWDYHPSLRDARVVWTVRPGGGGRWFTTFTEAGLLAKIGMNSSGLAVAVNMLRSRLDGGVDGTPIHVLLRAILERADTLTDALALAVQAPVSTSLALSLAYREASFAAMVTVELSPDGAAFHWPDRAGVLVHANHFVAGRSDLDVGGREFPSTYVRQFEAERRLEGARARDRGLIEELLRSHFGHPHGICCHRTGIQPWSARCETLASIVIDLEASAIWLADGAPCESQYVQQETPDGRSATAIDAARTAGPVPRLQGGRG